MAKILLVPGHGQGDPGAMDGGYNERDTMRKLADKIKAAIPDLVDVYDKSLDMYQQTVAGRGMWTTTYKIIIELHMDAANPSATGGHVIIKNGYAPNDLDKRLASAINDRVGWSRQNGFDYRDNLYNLNTASTRGIDYRLLELGFITNANDRKRIIEEMDATALRLVAAIKNETTKPKKEATFHGHIDRYAVGSREIDIEGWFLTTDSINETYPFILFMDGKGKEITRLKAERVLRPDLREHFPHTANWHQSGFKIKTVMPDILKGKGFHLLARMAQTPTGEKPLYEFYFDGVYSSPPKLNVGHLDGWAISPISLSDEYHFYAKGWHFSDNIYNGLRRWAFLLDAETHLEVARQPLTVMKRDDVQQVYPQYYLANESGFKVDFDVSKLKGKKVKLLVRYASDELGNKTVSEYLFDNVVPIDLN